MPVIIFYYNAQKYQNHDDKDNKQKLIEYFGDKKEHYKEDCDLYLFRYPSSSHKEKAFPLVQETPPFSIII